MTAPLPSLSEERRFATVLFADIQGFTTLAEHMDIEDLSDLIRDVWALVDSIIEKRGGYIDKHIGDAVMAVWGAPSAREDDAEQAVNAALELQNAIAEYAARSERKGAHELKMRVGINTGAVLAGFVGARGEYTVIGDAVNVASRLETNADPATIVISKHTYQLVRGLFKCQQLEPMQVKGKADPVFAFVVEGKLAQPNRMRYRGVGGLETYMVAREEELAKLNNLYSASLKSTTPILTLVRGEAGLGKSRLLLEFVNQLEIGDTPPLVFSSCALEQAVHAPFFIWKELWNLCFGLGDNDQPQVRNEKFLRGIQSLWGKQSQLNSSLEAAHLIGSLIGLEWADSPFIKSYGNDLSALPKRAFELTRDLFHHICTGGPAVLILDNLQWADVGSLDLLTYLVDPESDSSPLPLLVVGCVRPGLLSSNPKLLNNAEMINLKPLPLTGKIVANAYPALNKTSSETLDNLAKRADGNPYYLEEMVKSLLGSTKGDTTNSNDTDSQYQLPESLQAILQARLDSLSPEARWVALLASVVGRTFWVGAVLAEARTTTGTGMLNLASRKLDNTITQGLSELVRAEMAFPRVGSLFSGEQEYIFKHSLLREVAYELLPHKYRRQYHMAVARWLVTYAGSDFMATIAEHLEKAGAIRDAAKQYEQAAHYARSRGAIDEARWMQSRAHELMAQKSGSGILSNTN